MGPLRPWIVLSWVSLPTVMFGGFSLLRLLTRGDALTPFQVSCFRAGHAHAGVLLLMSLIYYTYLDRTALSLTAKHLACGALAVGILMQSGGFFLHMVLGRPDQASLGTTVTMAGAVLLAASVLVLAYGVYTAP
jgi:hypothetical protein